MRSLASLAVVVATVVIALAAQSGKEVDEQQEGRAFPPAVTARSAIARAIFAGGCFWCVESDFDHVEGVVSTTSGYTGGSQTDPSYEEDTSMAPR